MPGDIWRGYYWHMVGRAQLNIYSAQGSPLLRVIWPQMSTVWRSPGTKKPVLIKKGFPSSITQVSNEQKIQFSCPQERALPGF